MPQPRFALAPLAFAAVLAAGLHGRAYAQPTPAAPISVSIPAQSLGTALNELARQAGLQLLFPPALVTGKSAPTVSGMLTPRQAVDRLLAGSGLIASQENGTLVVKAAQAGGEAPTLPTVTVTSQAERQAGNYAGTGRSVSSKLGTALIETPRSISIVTQEQLQTQAPRTLSQALSYTAGVSAGDGTDLRMSGATIRGFSDGSSYYKDGLRQFAAGSYGSWNDDIDGLESIEVIKGPASILYGQGRPGGVINVLSKRPSADHVNNVGVSYGTYDKLEVTADLGGAIDDEGKLLYRLNLKGRDGKDRTVDSQDDRFSIAPSLLWNISARTQLTLLGQYSNERGTPKSWWPTLFTYPQIMDLPARLTAGDPSFDRFSRKTRSIGYEFKHETNDGWQLTQNLRYSTIDVDYQHIYAMDVLADKRSISRASLAQVTRGKTFTVDNRIQKDFQWGDLQHKFSMGLDYVNYKESGGLGFGWDVPNLDMYAPVYGQHINAPELSASNSDLKQTGIYTLNQLKLDRWVANLSLRHDKARTDQNSTTQPRISDTATTGSAGLLYLFESGWAPYLSYSTSFDPVTGLRFGGSPFEPKRGKQYEVGVKYQPPGTSTLITASAFDLTQTNVTTQDLDHPGFSIQTGEVRSTGLEVEGRVALTRELSALASYTYLNPRTTKSARPAEIGRQTFQTWRHMASLWLDYRPRSVPGLMLGGGVRYQGESPYGVSSSGVMNLNGAATLTDVAIAYDMGKYRVALNINNAFNKTYFVGPFRAATREAKLSFKYYW